MNVQVNSVALMRKMELAARQGIGQEAVRTRAKNQATLAAIEISDVLISELEGHPVTRELSGGTDANSSFLPKGNLASFFGLPQDLITSSLNEFRKLMDRPKSVTVKQLPGDKSKYEVSVNYPPLSEYYNRSPAPEEYGGSWLEKMENGTLQNFKQFLVGIGFANSRTGGGIQNPSIKKGKAFTVPHISYIKDIYRSVFKRGGKGSKILVANVSRFR